MERELEFAHQSLATGYRSMPLPPTKHIGSSRKHGYERRHFHYPRNYFQLRRFPNTGEAVRNESGEARDIPSVLPLADVPQLSLAANTEQKITNGLTGNLSPLPRLPFWLLFSKSPIARVLFHALPHYVSVRMIPPSFSLHAAIRSVPGWSSF